MINQTKSEKHFTASALIVKDDKVLLLYHKKLKVWLYPGGHVESYETPDEAVAREVEEETGLKIEILGEIDESLADAEADVSVLSQPYSILCERVGGHYHNDMIYLCRIIGSEEIKARHDESAEIKFFSLEELDNISLFPNFKRLLEKVLKK